MRENYIESDTDVIFLLSFIIFLYNQKFTFYVHPFTNFFWFWW